MDSKQLTPDQVASQCANPEGDLGKAVGEWMNRANLGISKAAYGHLQVNHGDRVLEIGPGNGALVSYLVTNDNAVNYSGIDISQTMVDAARNLNAAMVRAGRVDFVTAPAERIPFSDSAFDRAVAVNCIYFWDIPQALREIQRVLVVGGRLVVASNSPETMASNPFAKLSNGFRNTSLDRDELLRLHRDAGFSAVTVEDYSEDAKRMDGTPYVRRSYMTVAVK
jgi:SAM-dependent methyltransferase